MPVAGDGAAAAATEWPEWLPERWTLELKKRKDGRLDKYFIDPETGYVFRSKTDVIHYLESGEIRSKIYKRSPGSFKSSSPSESTPPSAARESYNHGSMARQRLFESPMSSCENVQEEFAEPSSDGSHLQNSGVVGFNPVIDLNNLGINKAQIEETNQIKENQHIVPDGILELSQGLKLEQVAGKLLESKFVMRHINASAPAELKQQQESIEPASSNRDDSLTGRPVKKKPPNQVPVRRSLRNRGADVNISAEADLVPHDLSDVLPLDPVAMQCGLPTEGPSKQVAAKLPKANEGPSKLKDGEVSQLTVNLQDEPVGTSQADSLLERTFEFSTKNPFKPANENSPKNGEHQTCELADRKVSAFSNGIPLQHSDINIKMKSSDEVKVKTDATELAKDREQQSCELLGTEMSAMLSDTPSQNLGINMKLEESDVLEANTDVTKSAIDKLPDSEKQPDGIAEEIPNLAVEPPADKASKSSNQIRGQSSKKTKTKVASNLPRRSSRRLAGINVDPAVEIVSEWSLKKTRPDAAVLSYSLTPQVISIDDSTSSETTHMPAPVSSSLSEDKMPTEHGSPQRRLGSASMEIEQKNPETSLPFPFGNTWPDPCIEFAFKTLTGDLPIFEDTIAIENFFHQHLTSAKNRSPVSAPSFTLNIMQPETPIQLDNVGRFNTNAVRINQECTLKNGIPSSDMNRRLKRSKMN